MFTVILLETNLGLYVRKRTTIQIANKLTNAVSSELEGFRRPK